MPELTPAVSFVLTVCFILSIYLFVVAYVEEKALRKKLKQRQMQFAIPGFGERIASGFREALLFGSFAWAAFPLCLLAPISRRQQMRKLMHGLIMADPTEPEDVRERVIVTLKKQNQAQFKKLGHANRRIDLLIERVVKLEQGGKPIHVPINTTIGELPPDVKQLRNDAQLMGTLTEKLMQLLDTVKEYSTPGVSMPTSQRLETRKRMHAAATLLLEQVTAKELERHGLDPARAAEVIKECDELMRWHFICGRCSWQTNGTGVTRVRRCPECGWSEERPSP